MDPSADVKPARLTRSLLGRSRQGALATLMEADAAAQAPCAQMLGEYFMASGPRAGSFALLDRLTAHTARLAALPLGLRRGLRGAARTRRCARARL